MAHSIHETIAVAISGAPFPTARSLSKAAIVLRAIEAAGWRLVPAEPLPEMVGAWWRTKNGAHFHDEPPPDDTSDYAAYRAMIQAAPKVTK